MPSASPRTDILALIARDGGDILSHASMQASRGFRHHGNTSVFAHSVAVAYVSVAIALRLRLRVDMRALVRAALLHDYFLYDWHAFDGGEHRLHGLFHARRALENARRDHAPTPVEEDAILRHMFPLTPIPPRFCEGWIICLADKACAACERLFPACLRAAAHAAEACAPQPSCALSSFQA